MIISRIRLIAVLLACMPIAAHAETPDEVFWVLANGKGGDGRLQARIVQPLTYLEKHLPDLDSGGQAMLLAWRPVDASTRVSTKKIGVVGVSNVYDLTYTFPPVLEAGQFLYQRLARVLAYGSDTQSLRVFYVLVADRPIFDAFRDTRIVQAGGRDVIAIEHRWSGNALNIEQHYYLVDHGRAVDLQAKEALLSAREALGKEGIQISHRGGIFDIEQLRFRMRTSANSQLPNQDLDLSFAIQDDRLKYLRYAVIAP